MLATLCFAVFALIVFGLCWAVWRYDLFEPEPPQLVTLAGGLGFLTGLFLIGAQASTIVWLEGHFDGAPWVPGIEYAAALTAPLFEDIPKLLLTGLLAWRLRTSFNDPLDGLIYGSIVGAGFAAAEALTRWPEAASHALALFQGVVFVIGHMVFGGVLCFALGVRHAVQPAHRRVWPWGLLAGAAFVLPLHFLYDLAGAIDEQSRAATGERHWPAVYGGLGLLLVAILLFFFLVSLGSELSKERFSPNCPRRPLGRVHREAVLALLRNLTRPWRAATRRRGVSPPGD